MKKITSILAVVVVIAGVIYGYSARKSIFPSFYKGTDITTGGCINIPDGTSCDATTSPDRIGPADIYPDLTLTPGATNPDITQDTIADTICNPNWSTKSIRPPVSYTNPLKVKQIAQYGYADTNTRDYEEDHLISLELGGSPTDPNNLWPEPYNVSDASDGGAHQKDSVENFLHREVCDGSITLDQAQKEIVNDWYFVFKNQTTPTPSYGSTVADPDDEQ